MMLAGHLPRQQDRSDGQFPPLGYPPERLPAAAGTCVPRRR